LETKIAGTSHPHECRKRIKNQIQKKTDMIFLISPSKTQDFTPSSISYSTTSELIDQSDLLINTLKGFSEEQLRSLMKISEKLATLNHQRFQDFHLPFDLKNSKQALLAFKGDVYDGIDVDNYTDDDFRFAQKSMRILSGLYGILRPLDLIQPYRLEMGTKLTTDRGSNLYSFWDDRITRILNREMDSSSDRTIVNLASLEYFKVIQKKKLDGRILTLSFKENKNGIFKVIGIYAKKARGMMSDFIIQNRIEDVGQLKEFSGGGYSYQDKLSTADNWVYTR